MKKVIFVDFDGTITKEDTCFAVVKAFAKNGWEEINRLWEEKKISTVECANQVFKLFDASLSDIKALVDRMEIDECFKDFLALSDTKGYEVIILSDGYDFNIQAILNRFGIDLKYYANRLIYNKQGFSIECPHQNPACKNCGTCKTSLIKELKNGADQIIYIGDGYSDMCPAAQADLVFAKDVLFSYCQEKGMNVVHISGFRDIIASGLV